jgi:hypothetical protein
MHTSSNRGSLRSQWMTVGMICGMALTLTGAAQARPIGTALGMPFRSYVPFLAANAARGNNVNALHLSQVVAGNLNTAVMTVGVNQNNNSAPADKVFIPAPGATTVAAAQPAEAIYEQINVSDQYIDQTIVGNGNNAALQVDINQQNTGTYTPVVDRFMQEPAYAAGPTQQVNASNGININNAHLQQTVVGNENTAVMTVNVNQNNASNLKIYAPAEQKANLQAAIPAVNVNVQVVNQVIIGDNNLAVATVNVNQQNL